MERFGRRRFRHVAHRAQCEASADRLHALIGRYHDHGQGRSCVFQADQRIATVPVGKFEVQKHDVWMIDHRRIDAMRQRARMKQFDMRKKLLDEQCKTGSEEFVIIDEQHAHRIVSLTVLE